MTACSPRETGEEGHDGRCCSHLERGVLRAAGMRERPVGFVGDIVAAAKAAGVAGSPGVYVGCGDGRNYVPLVAAGLDLLGLDISPVALGQLAARVPEYRDRLVLGGLSSLAPGVTYGLVIGIQVFQHGNRAQAHERRDGP